MTLLSFFPSRSESAAAQKEISQQQHSPSLDNINIDGSNIPIVPTKTSSQTSPPLSKEENKLSADAGDLHLNHNMTSVQSTSASCTRTEEEASVTMMDEDSSVCISTTTTTTTDSTDIPITLPDDVIFKSIFAPSADLILQEMTRHWNESEIGTCSVVYEIPEDFYEELLVEMLSRDKEDSTENGPVSLSSSNDSTPLPPVSSLKPSIYKYDFAVQVASNIPSELIKYNVKSGLIEVLIDNVPITFVITALLCHHYGCSWDDAVRAATLTCLQASMIPKELLSTRLRKFALKKVGDTAVTVVKTGPAYVAKKALGILGGPILMGVSIIGETAWDTVPDVYYLTKNQISKKQFAKNTTIRFAGTAAGTTGGAIAGYIGGSIGSSIGGAVGGAIGTMVLPGIGTVALGGTGAVVGGFVVGAPSAFFGGLAAGVPTRAITRRVLNRLSPDDAVRMRELIGQTLRALFEEFLINEEESKEIAQALHKIKWKSQIRRIYALKEDEQRIEYITALVGEHFVIVVSKRQCITREEFSNALKESMDNGNGALEQGD